MRACRYSRFGVARGLGAAVAFLRFTVCRHFLTVADDVGEGVLAARLSASRFFVAHPLGERWKIVLLCIFGFVGGALTIVSRRVARPWLVLHVQCVAHALTNIGRAKALHCPFHTRDWSSAFRGKSFPSLTSLKISQKEASDPGSGNDAIIIDPPNLQCATISFLLPNFPSFSLFPSLSFTLLP